MPDPLPAQNVMETRAFVERTASRTVCIVNLRGTVHEREKVFSEDIGTGTACVWRKQRLILTAKHVLEKAHQPDLAFVTRVGTSIDGVETRQKEVPTRVSLPIDRIIRCGWEDLAAIVLGPCDRPNVDFCELPDKFARNLSGRDAVVVMGYPVDRTLTVSRTKDQGVLTDLMAVVPTTIMGETVAKPSRPLSSDYDAQRHFLIRFDPADPGLLPFGYSGAGVWCDNRDVAGVWAADPLLAGVETHAYVGLGLLRAVKAEVVRQFLEESL